MNNDFDKEDQTFGGDEYNWSVNCDNLWELLTMVLLDTRTPLERLSKVGQTLKRWGWLDYRKLNELYINGGHEQVVKVLREAGYPFYNMKAKCFAYPVSINLETASFDELQTIYGIGPKLAAMWRRMVHGDEIPIIDTHVKRWLQGRGYNTRQKYKSLSEIFTMEAQSLGMTVAELDRKIISEGIARRKGIKHGN